MVSLAVRVCLLALLAVAVSAARPSKDFCKRGQDCWPTQDEITKLRHKLGPSIPRALFWDGQGPKPDPLISIPGLPETLNVFGGMGADLEPLYVQPEEEIGKACFTDGPPTEFCSIAARQTPFKDWMPSFIIFPINSTQVQTAVRFAYRHNLRICVTATGHDGLNRHSCNGGMMIRTGLLKSASWNLKPDNKFGVPDGVVKFGTGLTWEEVSKSAGDHGRIIASGWCGTVGVAGWHLGSGYGPFTRRLGNGGDQFLEVEIVLADGRMVRTNAERTTVFRHDGTKVSSQDTELFWALRGGGGSTFGIVTSLTVAAHLPPAGGVTYLMATYTGDMCEGKQGTLATHDAVLTWMAGLSDKWGMITNFGTDGLNDDGTGTCTASVSIQLQIAFWGPQSDREYRRNMAQLTALGVNIELSTNMTLGSMYDFVNWANVFNAAWKTITPLTGLVSPRDTSPAGASPSVFVHQDKVQSGEMIAVLHNAYEACVAGYMFFTGPGSCKFSINMGHAATGPDTPMATAFHGTVFHLFSLNVGSFPWEAVDALYALGDYSYFGESAYRMRDWPLRYWGQDNYDRLLAVKRSVDPEGVFTCHHCVGDDYKGTNQYGVANWN